MADHFEIIQGIARSLPDGARSVANQLCTALRCGLPLEAGLAARRLVEDVPPELRDLMHSWAVDGTDKATLPLTRAELERQLRIAHLCLQHGDVPAVVHILGEWLVNHALFALPWENHDWLLAERRAETASYLDSLAYQQSLGLADDSEIERAALWQTLRGHARHLDAAGMHSGTVEIDGLDDALAACHHLLQRDDLEADYVPPSGQLVITPLGLSPGVLYAVARRLNPSHLIILTSTQAQPRLHEALQRADGLGIPRTIRVLADPYYCYAEAATLAADAEIRARMLAHAHVVVNVTGGTTAMQALLERLAAEARRLGKRVRPVALIDRRHPDEQKVDPYVDGEVVELETVQG